MDTDLELEGFKSVAKLWNLHASRKIYLVLYRDESVWRVVFSSRVMAIEELEYDIKRLKGDCPLGLGK